MIKVLFFAKLSEQLGLRELFVEPNLAKDTEQLFQYLTQYKAGWHTTLTSQHCLKAVNQSMVNGNISLQDGDEVAYFPPVTGG
jgi:molybdopterin synthase sulfur carrier subunit